MKTNNKYKTLAANTAIFAIGSFGSKILAFMLTRLYTKFLEDASHFNNKEILELCANMLIPLVSLSIAEAIIRYGLDKNYENKTVFSNAVTLLLCGAGGFILLSPLLLLYRSIRPQVPLLVLFVLASCFRQVSTQFARARGMVKLFAADGIFCTLIFLIFNLIFIYGLRMDVTGFMLSNICADLCSGIGVWLIARHGKYFSFKYVDRELMAVMLRFSLPLIPAAELWLITGFSDRIFVEMIVDSTEAGVYGASAKIPNLLSMVSTIVYQAWNMSAIAENDSEGRSKFYTEVFEAYQAILTLAAGGIIAFDRFLSGLLIDTSTDSSFERAYLYTPVLVIAVLMMCYDQFLSSIYTVSKNTRGSLWTSLAAAVLNVVLNVLLIPKYGVQGAIAATFASYFVCYLLRIFDTRRYIPFEVSHLRFFANLAILFFMCRMIHMTDNTVEAYSNFRHLVPVFLAGSLAVLAVINFKPLIVTVRKVLRR